MLQLIKDVDGCEVIDLYVEHNISEHDIIDEAKIGHDIISYDDEVHCTVEKFVDNEVEIEVDNEVEIEVDNEVEVGDDVEVVNDGDREPELDWTTIIPTKITKPHESEFHHDNGEDSDQLQTPPGSEDDEEYERFPSYKVGEGTKFQLGMIFNNKDLVRDAIKEYDMVEKMYT